MRRGEARQTCGEHVSCTEWPKSRVCERDRREVAKGDETAPAIKEGLSFSCHFPRGCWEALGHHAGSDRGEEYRERLLASGFLSK